MSKSKIPGQGSEVGVGLALLGTSCARRAAPKERRSDITAVRRRLLLVFLPRRSQLAACKDTSKQKIESRCVPGHSSFNASHPDGTRIVRRPKRSSKPKRSAERAAWCVARGTPLVKPRRGRPS